MALSPQDLDRYREILREKRHALQVAMQALARDSAASTASATVSKLPMDNAEIASDVFEQDMALLSLESEEELLRQVETALERIEKGTYGTCEECEKPIDVNRLDFLPFATTCLSCQQEIEKSMRSADWKREWGEREHEGEEESEKE